MIGGDFRLGFSGYTTSTISYDATASELGKALTDLPSIDSVDVSARRFHVPLCDDAITVPVHSIKLSSRAKASLYSITCREMF